MKNIIYYLSLSLGLASYIFSHTADHLIFSKICIAPNAAQMVQIYNPTPDAINLNDGSGSYYLTDGANPSTDKYYYNITSGENFWSESTSDFFIEFPENTIIESDSYLTISMHDSEIYNGYYDSSPDLSLYEIAGEDSYYNFEAISVLGPSESLILFFWDGSSSTVKDVDYFLWGNNTYAIDKSGVDGYFPDTPVDLQTYIEEADENFSYSRLSNEEFEENTSGNGITGHDETSENLSLSWEIIETFEIILGCTNSTSTNYNSEANVDDGSCFTTTHTIGQIVTGAEIGFSATILGTVKSFADIRPSNGPQVIVLEDDNGYQIDAVVWDWDVLLSGIGYMFDPYNPTRYVVGAVGSVDIYNNSFQFEISSENNIFLYDTFYPQGNFIEDNSIVNAEIVTAPFVLIPTLGERLDFHYSFPSNSRVVVRILDLNGLFITSLVDRYYQAGGKVERYEDTSDWDGRDHLGQIVPPGTYLIHLEASNFQTGKTMVDVAPVVVGVHH